MSLPELEYLRAELHQLDAALIRLLSERQRIACQIGKIKRDSGIPFEQADIWNSQCLERQKLALSNQVSPSLISEVFESIHRFSLAIQQQETKTNE